MLYLPVNLHPRRDQPFLFSSVLGALFDLMNALLKLINSRICETIMMSVDVLDASGRLLIRLIQMLK